MSQINKPLRERGGASKARPERTGSARGEGVAAPYGEAVLLPVDPWERASHISLVGLFVIAQPMRNGAGHRSAA